MSHGISGHAASVFGFLMALALAPAPGTPLPTAPPAPGNGHGASAPHVAPGQGIAIHEVLFRPSPGRYEWVEMKNIGGAPARIAGFVLSDEDGNVYEFPASTPDVPPGSFVVVVFDGLDSSHNDYDFGDRRIVLHARRGGDLFDDRFDQVALYGGRAEASGEGKPAPARASTSWCASSRKLRRLSLYGRSISTPDTRQRSLILSATGRPPTAPEVAAVALAHIRRVPSAVVSFGQGCEGEPLLLALHVLLRDPLGHRCDGAREVGNDHPGGDRLGGVQEEHGRPARTERRRGQSGY